MASRARLVSVLPLLAVLVVGGWLPTAAQIQGSTYTSPTYGYTVTWNSRVWTADPQATLEAAGPDALDRLLLYNANGTLYIEGSRRYGGDPNACIGGEAQALASESSVSGFAPLKGSNGQPIAGSQGGATFAAFTATLTTQNGTKVDVGDYLECRTLVQGESVIVATVVAPADQLPQQVQLARPVIDSIALPAKGQLPAAQVFANLKDEAVKHAGVAGPLAGSVPLAVGSLNKIPAHVSLAQFYVTATFVNPYAASEHAWDIGFGFRDGGDDAQLKLVIDSDGDWYFKDGLGPVIASGTAAGLNVDAGGSNTLELATNGNTGYFALNGQFVSTLDLSSRQSAGDVFAASGFFTEDALGGRTTQVKAFTVWSLEPTAAAATPTALAPVEAQTFDRWVAVARSEPSAAGPKTGELTTSEGEASVVDAGVHARDFYALVRFVAPPGRDHRWDVGLAFRDQSSGEHYRLIINSLGRWTLQNGSQPAIATGAVPSIDLKPNGVNTIEVVAAGPTAGFSVNGRFIASLDVSAIDAPGNVWFGSGFDVSDVVAGDVTRYRDFEVWNLDGRGLAVPATPTAGTPVPSAAATPLPAAPTGAPLAVRLAAEGGSGVDGLAVLTPQGDATLVDVTLRGATGGELLVIQHGTCAALDPSPAFLLADPDATGRSQTTLRTTLADLQRAPAAIAVHKSAADYGTVVACGEIPGT